jgi:hypothetical protein
MKTYYNSDYSMISQTMLKDFMKSKQYYKKKYIDKILPSEDSEVYKVGTAVDIYVKHGKQEFLSHFSTRVLKKNNPAEYTAQKFNNYSKHIITETNWWVVKSVSEYLLSIPDVQFLNKHCLKDAILKHNNLIGELDYLYLDGEQAVIVDLKTAENIDKRPFFYKALEYGYNTQLAYYRMLVRLNYPEIKNVKCYILAAKKDRFIPSACFYEVSATVMDKQEEVIKNALVELQACIDGEKTWDDPTPSIKGAEELQLINETYNDII